MSKFNIDRKIGPLRLRAWLLVVNFVFNGLGLYGLSRVMVTGSGWPLLVLGAAGTLICIALLSQPSETD